jgi:hypothetical protein
MNGIITIIFNDTIIGSTDQPVTYQRETDTQIEYRVTDIKRDHTVSIFSETSIKFIDDPNFNIEKI